MRPTSDELDQSELPLEKTPNNPTLTATADPKDADKLHAEAREETPVGDSIVANPNMAGEREVHVLPGPAGKEVAVDPIYE